MRRLVTVLLAAVLILVFGMIAAMLSSCGATTTSPAQAAPTVEPSILQDGHEMHPWHLQDNTDGTPPSIWHMATGDAATPRSQWPVTTWTVQNTFVMQYVHIGSFLLYEQQIFQVLSIDVTHHFIFTAQM